MTLEYEELMEDRRMEQENSNDKCFAINQKSITERQ
jgi:hypothetical protein